MIFVPCRIKNKGKFKTSLIKRVKSKNSDTEYHQNAPNDCEKSIKKFINNFSGESLNGCKIKLSLYNLI